MAILETLRRLIGYRLGGGAFTQMAVPAGWNYQSYLQAYGQIGWLFGAVSLIANAVADSDWMLYKKVKKGQYEEIDDHVLIDLLDYVNPFQTRYQFILLYESYLQLVGEAFILLNFNKLGVPAEMWLIPPGYMSIITSSDKYISHYEYNRSGTSIRLEIPEIVHVMNPNPANPYRGIGATKAIATDLDSEVYAAKYQNKLFYNDATPRLFLEFPSVPPREERERLRDEFMSVHQGWRNAYKPAFLWGGAKANSISMTTKDMDFANLRKVSMDIILAAYHIPKSLIGASEAGSRARAEADEYIFSKYTIRPALRRLKEALNEQLCPLFDASLEFKFVDPVPEDTETVRKLNREDFQAGILTREEARLAIGMDAKAEGVFVMPFNVLEVPAKLLHGVRSKGLSGEQKEALWRNYAAKTEGEERWFINELKELWSKQQKEVIKNLTTATSADEALFDVDAANEEFDKAMLPLLTRVFEHHYKDGIDLVDPENPHADSKQLDEVAILWLQTRSLKLAKLLNGTTVEQLRVVLVEGFAQGESVSKLTKRVVEYYGTANKVRAGLVARTETIAAAVEGNLQGYEKSGVATVEWYTAVDNRTCEICEPKHGNEYALKKTHGLIPAHPNCRCVFVPVI